VEGTSCSDRVREVLCFFTDDDVTDQAALVGRSLHALLRPWGFHLMGVEILTRLLA